VIDVYYDPDDHDRVFFDDEADARRAMGGPRQAASDRWDPDQLDEQQRQRLEALMERNVLGEISDTELEAEQAKIYGETKP
jgi:hypothetical protein